MAEKNQIPSKNGTRFADKVVIVTGSSAGIGQATAIQFAKEGASITIHGQSSEKLEETKKLIIASGVSASNIFIVAGSMQEEATQDKIIDETVKHFGKLDILVNNAAVYTQPGKDSNSMEIFDLIMNVNVRAVYRISQLAVPHLEKTKGSIINISSALSEKTYPAAMPYSITKAALNHLTRNFASFLAPKGIRVNCVAPGLVHTEFITRHGVSNEQLQEMFSQISQHIPLGRPGIPAEQAQLIVNIAAPENSYMTGSIIFNDGGNLVQSH